MSPAAAPVLIHRNHPDRALVEGLIRDVYAREYAAKVDSFADQLIAMPNTEGGYMAAAGLRIGGGFFSEIYLDQPIEVLLSKHWQPPAQRGDIVEITTLAAAHPHASQALMAGILGYARANNIRFAFFTVTERLHMLLKRVGVPAEELAPATAAKITNPDDWGHYYATNPRVVAIHDAFVSLPAAPSAPGADLPFIAEDAQRA